MILQLHREIQKMLKNYTDEIFWAFCTFAKCFDFSHFVSTDVLKAQKSYCQNLSVFAQISILLCYVKFRLGSWN